MKPTWQSEDGRVKLWLGDCLEVMATWPDGAVDAVVTDPPYGNNYSTGWRQGVHRPSTRIVHDKLTAPLLNDTAAVLVPLLNDTAPVYWHAAPDRLDMVLPMIKSYWKVVNVICWDKGNCTAGDLECSYGKQWEALVFAVPQKSPLIGGRPRDVLRVPRLNGCDYVHPTQKPVEVPMSCISRHRARLVTDPFMGSGTTGVAALRLGRQFWGVEINSGYFEIAKDRIIKELSKQKRAFKLKPKKLVKREPMFEMKKRKRKKKS